MLESIEALKVLSQYRTNEIVLAVFTSNREWRAVSTNYDLDIEAGGVMSKASSIGLGLALALPTKKVIVLDADGSLLMNLGSLVTIANMAPKNLIHFVFENNVYRTTGGQPIPNAGRTNFAGMARAAGYAHAYKFADLESFKAKIETILKESGPTFVCLKVPPATTRAPYPLVTLTLEKIPEFMEAVQRSS